MTTPTPCWFCGDPDALEQAPPPPGPAFASDLGRALIEALDLAAGALAERGMPVTDRSEAAARAAIARVAELRDLAARWSSLVTALRPLVEAADLGALEYTIDSPDGDARIQTALRALRWFCGMEPEPPAFEPTIAPPPPEVLARLDEARAAGAPERLGIPAHVLRREPNRCCYLCNDQGEAAERVADHDHGDEDRR